MSFLRFLGEAMSSSNDASPARAPAVSTLGRSESDPGRSSQPGSGSLDLVHGFDFGSSRPSGLPSVLSSKRDLDILGMPRQRASQSASESRLHSDLWSGFEGSSGDALIIPVSATRPIEVPGYEILGELGRGGMGVVYKARQLRLNRVVALKMILAGDFASDDSVARFLSEAETVARLQHPNVVQIYAIGDAEGRPFVELEYVGGGSLHARLDGTPWVPSEAAELVERLACAIHEAHRLGIVHRDLKPGNILLTLDGQPKITDFGLAKSVQQNTGLTRSESILGSPSYMAPEQAEGRAREVGPEADIYGLGANLYELLTGRPPFVAPTILATLDLVKNAEPLPPSRLQPGLPRDIETICLKCLQKEPYRRYATAEELAADLRRFLKGEPIQARPITPAERAIKWIKRRPSTAALYAVCALSVISAATFGAIYRANVRRQVETDHIRLINLRTDAEQQIQFGRAALKARDWSGAQARFIGAQSVVRNEPGLAYLRPDIDGLYNLSVEKLAEQGRRDASRDRLARFSKLVDEALFYQSQYTGLSAEANLTAERDAARRALGLYAPHGGSDKLFDVEGEELDPAEKRSARESCYEMGLALAEATAQALPGEDPAAQARASLALLDQVRASHPITRAYHLHRADYLDRLGEPLAATAERDRASALPADGSTLIDNFLEGERAYRAGALDLAVTAFRKALAEQPDHFWSQYLIALCHLKSHRPAEAQAVLLGCQGRRPEFVWTYLLKGFAEGEMGLFELAEADFARAEKLGLNDDERYVLLVNRGVMRLRRKDPTRAEAEFRAAIALNPRLFQAHVNLSQAIHDRGDELGALATLDQAIALDPNQAVLYRARSQLHHHRGETALALADIETALARSPADDPARATDEVDKGRLLQTLGRREDALAAYDGLLAAHPNHPVALRMKGSVLMQLGRYEEAIACLDRCLALGKPSAALFEARGLALSWRGSYSDAISDFTAAQNAGRDSTALRVSRGWAYLFCSAPKLALRDFDAALAREPGQADALSGRGLAHAQLGQAKAALADARASIAAALNNPRLLYNAARVHCQVAAQIANDPAVERELGAGSAHVCRDNALALMVKAIDRVPGPDKARFWAEVVHPDTSMGLVRETSTYRALQARFEPTGGRAPARGASMP
jgi:serine/threonine protein kinase/tetratricopeptide (TPR) repeat protein